MPRRLANMESIVYFSPHKKHAIIVNKERNKTIREKII
jgi:hypothetical protein